MCLFYFDLTHFLGNGVLRINALEIYWPLVIFLEFHHFMSSKPKNWNVTRCIWKTWQIQCTLDLLSDSFAKVSLSKSRLHSVCNWTSCIEFYSHSLNFFDFIIISFSGKLHLSKYKFLAIQMKLPKNSRINRIAPSCKQITTT